MPRALYACALGAALLGASAAPASSPAVPSATPAPSSASAPVPQDTPVAPSRVAEARALIPPPLLYGAFRPEVGTFVEYEVSSAARGKTRVRAAVVGRTQRPNGEVLYQVEFDYHASKPRALVVLWVIDAKRPFIERLALSVPPHAPISVPVDLYADQPELRGTPASTLDTEVKAGPFRGKARQLSYKSAAGPDADVTTSAQVPLFGVQAVTSGQDSWVARASGTGARPELTTVPLSVPRFNPQ